MEHVDPIMGYPKVLKNMLGGTLYHPTNKS